MKYFRKAFSFLLIVALLLVFVSAANGNTTVYVTRTGSCYHRSGCSYLKSKIQTTLSAAVAEGYSACSRCDPPKLGGGGYDNTPYYSGNYSGYTSSQTRSTKSYTETQYQKAIKDAEEKATERAEAAAQKQIGEARVENDKKIAELEQDHDDTITNMVWVAVGVGFLGFLIGGARGRHKAKKEYERKEAERKKFEEEKLAYSEQFRGMSCREYAKVPSNVVLDASFVPVRIGNTVPTVYLNMEQTKYHRGSCRYARMAVPANIYTLSGCSPCQICDPPKLPGQPQWLKDYRNYMDIKKKYGIADPDLPNAHTKADKIGQ